MKRPLALALLSLLAVLVAGCDTFERRAHQRADTYATLSPEAREKLKKGVIEVGDTTDMVYIALGEPNEKRETAKGQTHREIWIYNSYYRDYAGTANTGYRRTLVFDPKSKRYFVYYEPVFADVYEVNSEERIRIEFENGKVVAIEQPKSPAAGK
jgi:hypothetical protein